MLGPNSNCFQAAKKKTLNCHEFTASCSSRPHVSWFITRTIFGWYRGKSHESSEDTQHKELPTKQEHHHPQIRNDWMKFFPRSGPKNWQPNLQAGSQQVRNVTLQTKPTIHGVWKHTDSMVRNGTLGADIQSTWTSSFRRNSQGIEHVFNPPVIWCWPMLTFI